MSKDLARGVNCSLLGTCGHYSHGRVLSPTWSPTILKEGTVFRKEKMNLHDWVTEPMSWCSHLHRMLVQSMFYRVDFCVVLSGGLVYVCVLYVCVCCV